MKAFKNTKSPRVFSRLAGVSYAVTAIFGLAVWYALVFTSVPAGLTPAEMVKVLFAEESSGIFLKIHLGTTLSALGLALVLLVWPPKTKQPLCIALAASLIYVAVTWRYLALDMLLLPCNALACLARAYWLALESQKSAL